MDLSYTAPDGCRYESPKNYAWVGLLGFCGCYSHHLYDLTFDILQKLYIANQTDDGYFYDYIDKTDDHKSLQELILHVFDDKGWTEHGSSVRGSWLTSEGLEVCNLIWGEADATR
jgi:hypothetical protein